MTHTGTALIVDAGIELPSASLTDNMFVIPRRVRCDDDVIVLDRSRTAAAFLQERPEGRLKYMPLQGRDVRDTVERASKQYQAALLLQPNTATLQTRQSMKLAARSLFADAAQIVSAEIESVGLIAALQLVAPHAPRLSPFEVLALFASLHRRMPTWFYAPSGGLFGGKQIVLLRGQLGNDPEPARVVVNSEEALVAAIVEEVSESFVSSKQTLYVRHAGCQHVVGMLEAALAEQLVDADVTVTVRSAESNSTALAARFGDTFLEATLLEPTDALIDFTNEAAGLLNSAES